MVHCISVVMTIIELGYPNHSFVVPVQDINHKNTTTTDMAERVADIQASATADWNPLGDIYVK